MSTRSTTHFCYAGTKKPTAIIYRHSDGYPSVAGADLLRFLDEVGKLSDTRFDDPAYLSAKYVVFLANEFTSHYDSKAAKMVPCESKLDFLSVGILDKDPSDIKYRYVVICSSKRPKVQCFERDGEWAKPTWKEIEMVGEIASAEVTP